MAVILFDNVIELLLVNQVEWAIENDRLWHSIGQGKWPVAKHRRSTSNFSEILKFSSNEIDLLSQEEKFQLLFCHRMRNTLYHKGRVESKLIEAAIGIYYHILKEKLIQWKPSQITDIYFMEDHHRVIIKKESLPEYNTDLWKTALNDVLGSESPVNNVPSLLRDYLMEKIEIIKYFLEVLRQDSPDFKGYNQILMFAAFDRKIKSNLEEIADRNTCDAISNALFPIFKSKWRQHPIDKLSQYKKRAENLANLDNGDALVRFLSIDKVIDELYQDANFATQTLADWIDLQLHNY